MTTQFQVPPAVARLSPWGARMSVKTGIRAIMDDIAASSSSAAQWTNLGAGNPLLLPEVTAMWRRAIVAATDHRLEDSVSRYSPSRGFGRLVAAVVDYFGAAYDWSIGPENVIVGAGAQVLSYLAASAFTTAQRPLVLPRLPDYAGYFGLAGNTVGIPAVLEPTGDREMQYRLDVDALERQRAVGMYLISNPANPTGNSPTRQEMSNLVNLAESRSAPLMVDNAYGEPFPRVGATHQAPTLHPAVVNVFTLSKAGIPGERIAFAIGDPKVVEVMVSATSNVMLQPPGLIQAAVADVLGSGELDRVCRDVIMPAYRARRTTARALLRNHMPSHVDWRLHEGEGGMFAWLQVDEPWFDDLRVYEALKHRKVLAVPGRHFFGVGDLPGHAHSRQCIRLTVAADDATLTTGVETLSQVLVEMAAAATSSAQAGEGAS